MRDLAIIMATAIPTEKLIADLEDAISEFQTESNDKTKRHLLFHLQMLMINLITDGDVEEAMKMSEHVERVTSVAQHFDNKN